MLPHTIWLYQNDFVTIIYGLKRTELVQSDILDHIKFPLIFLLKQLGILAPFFFLNWLLIKKLKVKINLRDKKLIFWYL